jgi:hypothetical protein
MAAPAFLVLRSVRDNDLGFGTHCYCKPLRAALYFVQSIACHLYQDAVTAYAHLFFELQIPPSDMVLSVDSAGAHFALITLSSSLVGLEL